MVEHQRIDEFSRDMNQREWTHHYQYVEERDDEGDTIPDGVFSVSDDEEFDKNREDFIADDYDLHIDDPSTFREFESDVDAAEDPECRQMIEAGFEPCPERRVRFAEDDVGSIDPHCAFLLPTTQVDPRAEYLEQPIGPAKIAL